MVYEKTHGLEYRQFISLPSSPQPLPSPFLIWLQLSFQHAHTDLLLWEWQWKTLHKNCLLCRLGNGKGKGNRPVPAGWGKLTIDTKIWIIMSFFCIFSVWIVGIINDKITRTKNQLLNENAATWIHDKDVVHFTIQAFCTTVNYWEEGPNFEPPPQKVNEL